MLRGADTIGGSCIKIQYGEESIILDYGMPLMASGGAALDGRAVNDPSITNGILLDVTGEGKPPLAFVISHAHPDHYGLVDFIPTDISVYVSEAAKALIGVGNIFYNESMRAKRITSCETYIPGKSFGIGPFKITAFLMDHSAFGACSILVEVGEKRIFYTGDFRGHGRKTAVNDYVINRVNQPDVMLMEGTTLDDGHPAIFPDEQSVEEAIVKLANNNMPIFVAGSGSNVDRLVSLYRAAKRTDRIFVIDLYQAYLLDQLKPFSNSLPPHEDDHLRVYYPKNQCSTIVEALGKEVLYQYKSRQIKMNQIDFTSGKYIFKLSNFISQKIMSRFIESQLKPDLVYSMWQGYQEKQSIFKKIATMVGNDWQYIHTSGHAYTKDLKKLAESIQPKKLIPIHTVKAKEFEKHFENIHIVENGKSVELD